MYATVGFNKHADWMTTFERIVLKKLFAVNINFGIKYKNVGSKKNNTLNYENYIFISKGASIAITHLFNLNYDSCFKVVN